MKRAGVRTASVLLNLSPLCPGHPPVLRYWQESTVTADWLKPDQSSGLTVETTAYVLLTLLLKVLLVYLSGSPGSTFVVCGATGPLGGVPYRADRPPVMDSFWAAGSDSLTWSRLLLTPGGSGPLAS